MGKIRVSVANLVIRFQLQGDLNQAHFFGLLSRRRWEREGQRLATALGGAAEVTAAGMELLQSHFGAKFLEGRDARFTIDDAHLEDVFQIFESRNVDVYEIDPAREILEELAEEKLPILNSPLLSIEQVHQLKVAYVKTVRQAPSNGTGTSTRDRVFPTRRLFNLFEMVVPQSIFEKFILCPAIQIVTAEEMATNQGGTTTGKARDGTLLGDNLIW